MSHSVSPADRAPARCIPPPALRPAPPARLAGVDLARGLAVFGMYAAHVGPDPDDGGRTGALMELTHGRASALFALLAGFSLILLTGRPLPRTGRAGRQAVGRVLIRSAVLLAVGTVLTMTGTQVEVILAYYGLYFVLALPLHRLKAGALAALAAAGALVLPQVLYVVQASIDDGTWAERAAHHDPLARISGTDGFVDLFFTGSYPVLTWMPFVLAGMALARLDLSSAVVRVRLAVTGCVLAVAGYGTSWVALRMLAAGGHPGPPPAAWWSDTAGFPPGDRAGWLLAASPHSETTLSIVGNTGVAVAALATCLLVTEALPRSRWLTLPVASVGRMSLTAYVLNIAGIWVLGIRKVPGSSLWTLLGFLVAATGFAMLWSRFFDRGPLEYLLNKTTGAARWIR
ncbi:DUF418 domain-containing protein [Streptomyces sp. NPDC052396]|uniref:DUF418 domain-containing protein n=1 Tax=Streptomyces sp. NPDC052396 TaxID=3365689 RepID=UPI0037D95DB2